MAVLALAGFAAAGGALAVPARSADTATNPAGAGLMGMAVPFELNQGQYPAEVSFAAPSLGSTLFVTTDGRLVHSFAGSRVRPAGDAAMAEGAAAAGWTLVESLVGAGAVTPRAGAPAATRLGRFKGSAAHGNIATVHDVHLGETWPGIEVMLKAYGDNVEKIFTVAPGADPAHIDVRVDGAQAMSIADDGSLQVATGNGPIAFTAPIAWQENANGERETVEVRYRLDAGHRYGFVLAHYDATRTVWIDPLLQSTYLGGTGEDAINALELAQDGSGDVYVAGRTASTAFPGTTGGVQPGYGGGTYDVFIARLSGDLTTLRQATYLGGSAWDQVGALLVGASGDVHVAGYTSSGDFPGTSGGSQPLRAGVQDGFVARLSGDLATLIQSTYVGGRSTDIIHAMAIGPDGDIYVTGETLSTDFPVSSGAAQPAPGGDGDAFVVRLSNDLKTRRAATYLGSSAKDLGHAIAVTPGGDVYVSGSTASAGFPAVGGGAQAAFGGGTNDLFLTRLSGDLSTLRQSTYFGGSDEDGGELARPALAINAAGDVYVVGRTKSDDLPGTAGGVQPARGSGGYDAFVARFSMDLTSLQQSTYLGGAGLNEATDLVLAADGDVYVTGRANRNFPGTAGGIQPLRGAADAFVARLDPTLRTIRQATYLGGAPNAEIGNAIRLGAGGVVYVAGYTEADDFPGTAGGYQATQPGGRSGFISRMTDDLRGEAGFTVGGKVSGLDGGGLVLALQGETLAIAADGPFTFATLLSDGAAYTVTIATQPPDQTCVLANVSGTVAGADVTDVEVTCSITGTPPVAYHVGGTVSGLAGGGLVLQLGSETLAISSNGVFVFASNLADGEPYAVTVAAQPAGQACTITNGSGNIAGADVDDVQVTCRDSGGGPPNPPEATPVPALSTWALLVLAGLVLLVAGLRLGRSS